jgi:hypothetical protein
MDKKPKLRKPFQTEVAIVTPGRYISREWTKLKDEDFRRYRLKHGESGAKMERVGVRYSPVLQIVSVDEFAKRRFISVFLRGVRSLNGMVRRGSLEVVEYGGKEASHETTRAGH